MYNKITLIGRITKDLELRYTTTGTPVTRFTVATDRGYKSEDGEKQTDFIDTVVWKEQAENCAKYLNKGSPVAVEGRLQIRSYDDKDGIRRKAAEVIANRVIFLPNGSKKIEDAPFPEEGSVSKADEDFEDMPF